MNYEHKNENISQEIILKDRKKLEISGVKKINSLNSEEFFINTTLGDLLIRGEDLEMLHLDIERGLLWIKGYVSAVEYIENMKIKKDKTSIMGKLFK